MVVIGGIIGAGIFINPHIVAQRLPTDAQVLAAWTTGGLVALVGAFAYAELGRSVSAGRRSIRLLARRHPSARRLSLWMGAADDHRKRRPGCGRRSRSRQYALRLVGRARRLVHDRWRSSPSSPCRSSTISASGPAAAFSMFRRAQSRGARPAHRGGPAVAGGGVCVAGTAPRRRSGRLPSAPRSSRFSSCTADGRTPITSQRRSRTRAATCRSACSRHGDLVVVRLRAREHGLPAGAGHAWPRGRRATPASEAAAMMFGGAGIDSSTAAIAISTFGFLNLAMLAPTRVYYAMAPMACSCQRSRDCTRATDTTTPSWRKPPGHACWP